MLFFSSDDFPGPEHVARSRLHTAHAAFAVSPVYIRVFIYYMYIIYIYIGNNTVYVTRLCVYVRDSISPVNRLYSTAAGVWARNITRTRGNGRNDDVRETFSDGNPDHVLSIHSDTSASRRLTFFVILLLLLLMLFDLPPCPIHNTIYYANSLHTHTHE